MTLAGVFHRGLLQDVRLGCESFGGRNLCQLFFESIAAFGEEPAGSALGAVVLAEDDHAASIEELCRRM